MFKRNQVLKDTPSTGLTTPSKYIGRCLVFLPDSNMQRLVSVEIFFWSDGDLTYDHELWVVTERTRSWKQVAKMSILCRVVGLSLRDRCPIRMRPQGRPRTCWRDSRLGFCLYLQGGRVQVISLPSFIKIVKTFPQNMSHFSIWSV